MKYKKLLSKYVCAILSLIIILNITACEASTDISSNIESEYDYIYSSSNSEVEENTDNSSTFVYDNKIEITDDINTTPIKWEVNSEIGFGISDMMNGINDISELKEELEYRLGVEFRYFSADGCETTQLSNTGGFFIPKSTAKFPYVDCEIYCIRVLMGVLTFYFGTDEYIDVAATSGYYTDSLGQAMVDAPSDVNGTEINYALEQLFVLYGEPSDTYNNYGSKMYCWDRVPDRVFSVEYIEDNVLSLAFSIY